MFSLHHPSPTEINKGTLTPSSRHRWCNGDVTQTKMGSRVAASGHLQIEHPHMLTVWVIPFSERIEPPHRSRSLLLRSRPKAEPSFHNLIDAAQLSHRSSGQQARCEEKTESCWCKGDITSTTRQFPVWRAPDELRARGKLLKTRRGEVAERLKAAVC